MVISRPWIFSLKIGNLLEEIAQEILSKEVIEGEQLQALLDNR
jgi:hypothetical protein